MLKLPNAFDFEINGIWSEICNGINVTIGKINRSELSELGSKCY